jgi:hypothetical protein
MHPILRTAVMGTCVMRTNVFDRVTRMMRQLRVVDVVRAVQRIAPAHEDVQCWWYAPARRVGPDAKPPVGGRAGTCEIVIDQVSSGAGSSCETIARELGELLGEVSVRSHRGELEQGPLIRLVSHSAPPRQNGAAA